MWRIWRVIDPRKAIVLTGLMIAFISTSIHLIQISGDRYNINSWHPDTAQAAAARIQHRMRLCRRNKDVKPLLDRRTSLFLNDAPVILRLLL